MNEQEKQELVIELNNELETMSLEDLKNFYFDRRWDEKLIEHQLIKSRLQLRKGRPYGHYN